jgi:phosphohistidine swiveling domain-containing protein
MHLAGLPVPPSGVVTTDVYRRLAADPAVVPVLDRCRHGETVPADEIDRAFAAATMGRADRADIAALAQRLGRGDGIALRSSATVEDLGASSFAGQYRSVLRVDPDDEDLVVESVAAVCASLWHPAPRAYRRHLGIDDASAAMAVLVMAMVPARTAGVVFTADPGGEEGAARIEWVDGTAEDLVAGARTGGDLVVARVHPSGAETALGPALGSALSLALRAEAVAGCAQDVEWAWDGDKTWLVQARPVTTDRPLADDLDDPIDPELDLTTAAIDEVLPGVLAPLTWGIASHVVEQALRSLMAGLGALPPEPDGPVPVVRRVRGRAAMAVGPVGHLGRRVPHSSASEVIDAFVGLDPGAAAEGRTPRPWRPWRWVHDARVLRVEARTTRSALIVIEVAGRLSAEPTDLGARDDRDLVAYELRLVDLGVRAAIAQVGVAASAVAARDRLLAALGGGLRPDDARRAADLFVAGAGVVAPAPLEASAACFAGPTWAELGQEPPRGRDATEDRDAHALDQLLAAVPDPAEDHDAWLTAPLRLRRVERCATDALDRLRLRERAKRALLTIGGEVRRTHLEMGARLADRGALVDASDVDLLLPSELHAVLLGGPAVAPATLARRRRAAERNRRAGPLPVRFRGVPEPETLPGTTGGRLVGTSLSPGWHRGRAVYVESSRAGIPPGSVLVAVSTDPSWSPLFLDAGAIVVERGGTLSHTAILARELGVPAVSGVALAPDLVDGLELTVDGDEGVVVVHRDPA